jgi:hypothetical protein
VSRELNSFIRSVPNGSIIRFRSGGSYRLNSGGIALSGRRNLVLNGNGAKLKSYGCGVDAQPIRLNGSSGITIKNVTVAGNNSEGGTRRAHRGGCEYQAGIGLYGSFNTRIKNVTIRRTNGDCVYVAEGESAGRRVWSSGLVFRDSTCRENGRMGVAVVGGRDIVVTRVRFDKIAMYVFDVEPNRSTGGGANIRFVHNQIGTYSIDPDWSPYFFAANGAAGSNNIRDVKVTNNRVTGGTLRASSRVPTRRNIVFTGNVSTVPANGPVLFFEHVRGLTISGNVQPLRSGQLAHIRSSSGVTYRP